MYTVMEECVLDNDHMFLLEDSDQHKVEEALGSAGRLQFKRKSSIKVRIFNVSFFSLAYWFYKNDATGYRYHDVRQKASFYVIFFNGVDMALWEAVDLIIESQHVVNEGIAKVNMKLTNSQNRRWFERR